MIDFLLLLVLVIVAWCVASEGAWGAGLTFFAVLFAGLLAMNWFEPLANRLQAMYADGYWPFYWDIIALLGLFTALVFGFRFLTDSLMPTFVDVGGLFHNIGRWGLGLATGYLVTAIFLTALHTAPMPREWWGFVPERKNLFDVAAPDRQWLAFTQYVSEKSLRSGSGPVFDAVSWERIGGKPETMQTWSSFPIRYATRREMFMKGGVSSGSPAPPSGGGAAPPTTVAPSGGGPSSGF